MAISEADFQQLSRLLDEELDAEARQDVEQRIALEPELADTWRRLQAMNTELRLAYADSEAGAVPGEIRALLGNGKAARGGSAANVVPLFGRRQLWPAALAASLVLAVSIALLPDGAPRQPGMTLASALDSMPSGESWHALGDGSQVRAVLTFPNHDGGWCREFLLREADAEGAVRGVACRAAEDWRTEVIAQGAGPDSSDVYRPAGAGDSDAVHQFIRDHAADIPLDGPQESRVIARNWR